MIIDGAEVKMFERDGRYILERALVEPGETCDIGRLASLAAGRFLREEATLSWDDEREVPVLWQDGPATMTDAEKERMLTRFLASVDWWVERIGETPGDEPVFPDMIIHP